jgi:Vitamin K-dependent gamma-carboxylase
MTTQALEKQSNSARRLPASSPILPWREFFSLDVRSLALFRIGLGLAVICDSLDRLPDLRAHYSDAGIVPRADMFPGATLSLHFYSGDVWLSALLTALTILFGIGLLIGYRTPIMTFLAWWLTISVHARLDAVMQGGDVLLRMLLFWGMFLPLGACYSLDASEPDRRPRSPRVLSPASVALIAQICIVYWFAAAWKWDPVWRSEGTAVYLALQVDYFVTRLGKLVGSFPAICQVLTYSSLYLETLGPVMLFLPFAPSLFRVLTIAAFILFHAGLAISLELGNFPFVCMVAWLALLPTDFWERLFATLRASGLQRVTVLYDPRSDIGRRIAGRLQAFLALPDGHLAEALETGGQLGRVRSRGGWAVVDAAGKECYGPQALSALVAQSAIFRPLVRFASGKLGAVFLSVMGLGLSWRPSLSGAPPSASRWTPPGGSLVNLVVSLLILYVVLINVAGINVDPSLFFAPPQVQMQAAANPSGVNGLVLPMQLRGLAAALGLEQGWGLFAPSPGRFHGWFVVTGYRRDGNTVNVLDPSKPADGKKPELLSLTYTNGRWRKLFSNLQEARYSRLSTNLANYYLREWNRTHGENEQLVRIELYQMRERSVPPGVPKPEPEKVPMFPPPESRSP